MWPGAEQVTPVGAPGVAGCLELATALPWLTSDSRRRPPLWGRRCGGGRQGHFPAAAVAGHSPALMGKGKVPSLLARLRGRLGIKS